MNFDENLETYINILEYKLHTDFYTENEMSLIRSFLFCLAEHLIPEHVENIDGVYDAVSAIIGDGPVEKLPSLLKAAAKPLN